VTVVLVGIMAGLGCVGVLVGSRGTRPSLDAVAGAVDRPLAPSDPTRLTAPVPHGPSRRIGVAAVALGERHGLSSHPRWSSIEAALDITGRTLEQTATTMALGGAAGLLVPPMLWLLAAGAGVDLPLAVAVLCAALGVLGGLGGPLVLLLRQARERRRHFRVFIGTFVDLVVLGLAGGVGVEGAMLAASQVSSDWAARRMDRALRRARDSGQSPWAALGRLGEQVGVPELVELSTTLQLAGTEGARIRQSLSARAVALRRHEQADAESEANAVTERLFLPGALLLIGFLVFIGYPAFARILGGF